MWQRMVPTLAAGCLLMASSMVQGQEPPPRRVLLIARSDLVRFEIVLGRLVVVTSRHGQAHQVSFCCPRTGIRESLALATNGMLPSLRYECHDGPRSLVVEVTEGCQVRIVSDPGEATPGGPVELAQLETGPLQLAVGSGPARRKFTADSLWHLLLAEPQVCRVSLVPMLSAVHPHWQLQNQAGQVTEALARLAGEYRPERDTEIAQLVAQLGSQNFRERQQADRRLRTLGYAALPFLETAGTDAEQRYRLQAIRRTILAEEPDTPDRVALWLCRDKSIWLALMDDDDPELRALAARHLARLWPHSIPFDADADPDRRRAQLDEITACLHDDAATSPPAAR